MVRLLNLFGFLAVLLRALTLSLQSLVAGGIVFGVVVLRQSDMAAWKRCSRFVRWAAAALVVATGVYTGIDAAILRATADLTFGEIAKADFVVAGVIAMLAASVCAVYSGKSRAWLTVPAAVLIGCAVCTSHAAALVNGREAAMALTFAHQAAAATWLGGMPFLLLTLGWADDSIGVASRFSQLALVSVAALLIGGLGLSLAYVDNPQGLFGTSYGVMIVGKAILLGLLVLLGGLNYGVVRELGRGGAGPLLTRLRRLSESEVGIGFTAILAAASLTSQPPAASLVQGRATVHDVVSRFTPRAPRLKSPTVAELSQPLPEQGPSAVNAYVPGAKENVNTPGDIAWSEYNHNWAGLTVLAMGVMAVASRVFGLRWARHWPLAFLGLAYFLLVRADPENWPLGPRGFWTSMAVPDVLQHRLFALMIVAFAVFEEGIQLGRIRSRRAALVFPGVCAMGGALLLTHSHSLGNVREEYLAELSHLSIALLAVAAGWSRWLEQRLAGAWRCAPSYVWPACFVAIGLLLLFYREA